MDDNKWNISGTLNLGDNASVFNSLTVDPKLIPLRGESDARLEKRRERHTEWARKECYRLMEPEDAREVFEIWKDQYCATGSNIPGQAYRVSLNIRQTAEIINDPRKLSAYQVTKQIRP